MENSYLIIDNLKVSVTSSDAEPELFKLLNKAIPNCDETFKDSLSNYAEQYYTVTIENTSDSFAKTKFSNCHYVDQNREYHNAILKDYNSCEVNDLPGHSHINIVIKIKDLSVIVETFIFHINGHKICFTRDINDNYKGSVINDERNADGFIDDGIIDSLNKKIITYPSVDTRYGIELKNCSFCNIGDNKLGAFCEVVATDEIQRDDDLLLCIAFYNKQSRIADLQYEELTLNKFAGFTIIKWYPFDLKCNLEDVTKVLFFSKVNE